MPAPRLALCLALLLAPACSGGDGGVKDEDLGALVIAPPDEPPPVDPAKAAADPRELARAIAIRHHDVAKALGAHTVKLTSKYEVKEGDKVVDSLSDETTLEVAADGQYHAVYANSADYGREVVYQSGTLYLRPRYARWHRRPPTDKHEAAAILDQMYATVGDYYDLVAHAAELTDKGAAKAAGRDGRHVTLALAPSPGKPPAQPLTQRKWRESVVVSALSGDVVLDADGAFPLQATFAATIAFSRDGRSFTMTLEASQTIDGIGSAVAIATPPPDETVDTPERLKEVDERDFLLEGMAPPAKKSGGNDEALPGAGAAVPPPPPAQPGGAKE